MKRTFAYGAFAHQGSWPVQEDGYFVDPTAGFFAVADGFGGRGNGDLAAKLVLQRCRSPGPGKAPANETSSLTPVQLAHHQFIAEAHVALRDWNQKRSPAARGGASLILASVERERQLVVSGCGACSAFLVREGRWLPVLAAQAPPRVRPRDPLLPAQALGLGRDLAVESRAVPWETGDLLFLFSSGLAWEVEPFQAEATAQLALRAPGSELGAAAALAARFGGADCPWNQTVVVVEALP